MAAKPRRQSKIIVMALLCIVLAGIGWRWGWPHFALRQATQALTAQRSIAAARWLPFAVNADPATVHFLSARTARKLGDYEQAARELQAALRDGFDRRRVELEILLAEAQRGRLAPLEAQLSSLLSQQREPDEVCEAFVEGCLLKYRLDNALQILKLWQADYPDDPRPHLLRGRILEHDRNLPGARLEFSQALEKNPRYAAAAYNLARVELTEQQPRQALELYRRCARDLGNPQPGLVGEAHCSRLLREYDRAERLLQQAQAVSPAYLDAAYRLVGEPSESAAARLPVELGRLALDRNDYPRAVEFLMQAFQANPRDWKVRYDLAIALRQTGRVSEAETHLRIVEETKQALDRCDRLITQLQQDPTNAEARFEIGQVFLKYVSENQGLVWLNSVLDYDPDHRGAHEELERYFREHQAEHPEYADLARHHREILSRLPESASAATLPQPADPP